MSAVPLSHKLLKSTSSALQPLRPKPSAYTFSHDIANQHRVYERKFFLSYVKDTSDKVYSIKTSQSHHSI
ncbi:hypothetical protein HZ326_10901 [Fusarium oxysporum f. sp. albedinis]|nr:hypothetical protein HZ326_10901 [Fusarium oxysporum f. sp. albedinis]